MTFFGMAVITAVATAVLAVFAIVTAAYARKAFLKQSQAVVAIEQQVSDQKDVTAQQAELIGIQSDQLEVLRAQLDDQRSASAKHAEALELQAAELRESPDERKRETERKRRGQAAMVFLAQTHYPGRTGADSAGPRPPHADVTVVNSSDQPVYNAELLWRRGSATGATRIPSPPARSCPGPDRAPPELPAGYQHECQRRHSPVHRCRRG